SLHSLFLRRCQIGCKGVIAIASLLVPHNSEWAPLPIKTLDLSRNEIGIDGVTALAKVISWDGCSLKALDLSRCNITGERSRGLHRLFSVLRSNARNAAMASANLACVSTKLPSTGNASNLLTLKLNGNDLDSNCFNAIAACIAGDSFTDDNNRKVHYCPSLKNLYLDNTNMSSSSAKKLAKALVTNTGLKILSLSENLIGDDAAKALQMGYVPIKHYRCCFWAVQIHYARGCRALATCVYDETCLAI
ncbi:leucine-rich repeat protein, partial [Skeletonema marinoi]